MSQIVADLPIAAAPVRDEVVPAKARLDYVHYARGLAILAIMLVHTNQMWDSPPNALGDVINDLLRDVTASFVLISGFLFQYLSGRFTYSEYIWRKCRFILIPYVVVSIPPILLYLARLKTHPWLPPEFFHQSPLKVVSYFFLTGQHLGPLWFIPVIALFFALAPIFLLIDRYPRLYWSIVPLLVLSTIVPRPVHNSNPMQAFIHLLPAYLIGMWASRYRDQVIPELGRRFWLLALLAVSGLYLSTRPDTPLGAHLVLKLPIFLAMLALFVRFDSLRPTWLSYVADISFGLYFVHAYLVGAGRMLVDLFGAEMERSPVTLVVGYASIVVLSIVVVEAFRRTFGERSRYLIGA